MVEEGEEKKKSFLSSLFRKKGSDKDSETDTSLDEPEEEVKQEETEEGPKDANIENLQADLDRLKAQFDTFKEIRKAFTERFTRVSEQIGELRSMMIERDRDLQKLEAKALKAIDLVETVQPEKLMTSMRKGDGKIEALRANLESNEAIMGRISEELKAIRNRMDMFKGVEQVTKMNEEVKSELIDIKKIEAVAGSHADKVSTIFMEMQNRFKDLETFKDQLNNATLGIREQGNDISVIKIRVSEMVKKDDLDKAFDAIKNKLEGIKKKLGKSPLTKDLDSLKDMLEDLKI